MTKPKVFVAVTTTHGSIQSQFITTLTQLFANRTFDMDIWHYVDPYIVLARNAAAADLLKGDSTHILFLDADIIDPTCSQHIQRMLDHDVDIVGGLYCKKCESPGPIWVCNALDHRPPEDERGLLQLRHIGTGFLLIKRGVFERMIEEDGDKIGYLEDVTNRPMWDFFDMPRVEGRKMSEDWHFCNEARRLGFTVYGDTKVLLRHAGGAVFPLKTQVAQTNLGMQKVDLKVASAG
jgi:hypothetical protein